jgi:hypothetical protein
MSRYGDTPTKRFLSDDWNPDEVLLRGWIPKTSPIETTASIEEMPEYR